MQYLPGLFVSSTLTGALALLIRFVLARFFEPRPRPVIVAASIWVLASQILLLFFYNDAWPFVIEFSMLPHLATSACLALLIRPDFRIAVLKLHYFVMLSIAALVSTFAVLTHLLLQ